MSAGPDFRWSVHPLEHDVRHGFIHRQERGAGRFNPEVVLNQGDGATVLRTIREELKNCDEFLFSVAFVTPGAIAMLKQDLLDFSGSGTIVTASYLNFNSPAAFEDLHHLKDLGLAVDVLVHPDQAFHPKGYIFKRQGSVTALIGSSNLTATALTRNYEWNLKVSAADESDLAEQISRIGDQQHKISRHLTRDWIAAYALHYRKQPKAPVVPPTANLEPDVLVGTSDWSQEVIPNAMQEEALNRIQKVREDGHDRAIVISATGTGKTILSALDVKAFGPQRFLFLVHREQIIDRTIQEYRRVFGGTQDDYGKVAGGRREIDAPFVFATIQSLSRPELLQEIDSTAFDYILVDEAHRVGAETYKRVLEHLKPKFLLGMTATPERTDGDNVFEIFDYQVPYEIRLKDALEADMLVPFHYYGVADVMFEDGTTIDADSDLSVLTNRVRVDNILEAIDRYAQQGVETKGLIFCSRKLEAHALSEQLNSSQINGRWLRTRALTGEDSPEVRARAVDELEQGRLDYLLTVDIFNEGVDIPSINQIIMLRQTQSAIIFVQQLGRGLRKAEGKDHLTVIDFIGNYKNNFMIPIALFGDKSLNKESLRKNLSAAEEDGVLPGLSSVRFDKIAREHVMRAISSANLETLRELKREIEILEQRLGRLPSLRDFWEQNSVDPVVLSTKGKHYPALLSQTMKQDSGLRPSESRMLELLSHEVLPAKRLHELVVLEYMLSSREPTGFEDFRDLVSAAGLPSSDSVIQAALDTYLLNGYNASDLKRYETPLLKEVRPGIWRLTELLETSYDDHAQFRAAVDDVIWTGKRVNSERYRHDRPFTQGRQYSRRDACRLLGWKRSVASTIYGYKTDTGSGAAPLFVTLHKAEDVEASVAYEDELIDRHTMRWFTRSRRTLASGEVRAIVDNEVAIHVFVKRDDAEGSDFYYLGRARSDSAEQTTMPNSSGEDLNVVRMLLHFDEAIDHTLYDFFHPTLTS